MERSKADIRREVLNRRKLLGEAERTKASLVLTARILGHQWYDLSEVLLGFMPYKSEIDTTKILLDALKKGKEVYLPKVTGDEMSFFRIFSLEELEEGYQGILEPNGKSGCFVYNEVSAQKTFMIMPGVAFDSKRNRIGYGKGYYDRYLQGKKALQLRTIAVGYQCQMVGEIPAQETDIKPYQVLCV